MKLFSDLTKTNSNSTTNQPKNNASQQVVVISPRREILTEITSHLLMHNLKNVVEHEVDFFTLKDDGITHNAMTVIVDIVNENDTTLISETTTLLISAASRRIFVGNNDSINFAQTLMRSGINYLHVGSQLTQLIDQIHEQKAAQSPRATMKISILGCKGGVGTSRVAYQLFQATSLLSSIPALLVQGASGSGDLDLLMGCTLPKDGSLFKTTTNQAVRIETQDSAWIYEDQHFNQYNLVFFDHGIYRYTQDHLEMVISQSHTIILVISRELTTLRTAKTILDEYNRLKLINSFENTRILICLNENHPYHSDELKDEDIREFLGCEISCVNPYNICNDVTSASPLYKFATHLLGKTPSDTFHKKKSALPALFRRYLPQR